MLITGLRIKACYKHRQFQEYYVDDNVRYHYQDVCIGD
jgi:hypothetical protein